MGGHACPASSKLHMLAVSVDPRAAGRGKFALHMWRGLGPHMHAMADNGPPRDSGAVFVFVFYKKTIEGRVAN